MNYLRSTEPEHVESKTKLGRIGIEFYGKNNNYKVKIRMVGMTFMWFFGLILFSKFSK